VIEFTASDDGVKLPGRNGYYLAAPVEYKRGRAKKDHSDEAQLCAQAICLEEMLSIAIPIGYLYYGQTRRRLAVELSDELRSVVMKATKEMHTYYQRGYTPRVKPFKGCRSCSMADVCLPMLQEKTTTVAEYIRTHVEE